LIKTLPGAGVRATPWSYRVLPEKEMRPTPNERLFEHDLVRKPVPTFRDQARALSGEVGTGSPPGKRANS
jgi:hypothetical protein